jgi:hypothetical protein
VLENSQMFAPGSAGERIPTCHMVCLDRSVNSDIIKGDGDKPIPNNRVYNSRKLYGKEPMTK